MDGSTLRYKAFLIACGNASQYGNNAYIAPQATLNDGLLDVTILEPFTVLDVPSLSFQLIGFRTVLQAFEQSLFQISKWSSPSRIGELQAYKCVESHAAGAEERHIVDFSVVNDVYQSVIDDVDGLFRLHRNLQMAGKSVAGTAGNDAQSGFCMYQ